MARPCEAEGGRGRTATRANASPHRDDYEALPPENSQSSTQTRLGMPTVASWRRNRIHGALHPYSTMSVDELKALAVRDLAAENSVLFLWQPRRSSPKPLELSAAWGLRTGPLHLGQGATQRRPLQQRPP